jgi:phosphoglucosamine mutase
MIFGRYATTGDGLITALQLIVAILESKRSFSELAGEIPRYPQVLINVTVKDKAEVMNSKSVQESIHAAEVALANNGRILVRPSGTEPYIRVMVEAANESQAKTVANTIVEAINTFDAQ